MPEMATATSTAPGSSKRSSAAPTEYSSPVRKRKRTSPVSSDAEEFWDELDADGRAPLDVIEQHHTQKTTSDRGQSPINDVSAAAPVAAALEVGSATEAPTPATTVPSVLRSPRPSLLGAARSRSSSPHPGATIDYSYADTTNNSANMTTSTELPSFVRASGGMLYISTSALEMAVAMWQSWEQEDDKDDEPGASTTDILKPIRNVFARPSTPKPAAVPAPLPVAAVPSSARTLTAAPAITMSIPAPVTLARPLLSTGSTSRGVPGPIAVAPASNAAFHSPRLGMTSRVHALAARPKFVTPFNRGIFAPTQPGRGTAGSTPLSTSSALSRSTT